MFFAVFFPRLIFDVRRERAQNQRRREAEGQHCTRYFEGRSHCFDGICLLFTLFFLFTFQKDEPTSSLDSETETRIIDQLETVFNDRTVRFSISILFSNFLSRLL